MRNINGTAKEDMTSIIFLVVFGKIPTNDPSQQLARTLNIFPFFLDRSCTGPRKNRVKITKLVNSDIKGCHVICKTRNAKIKDIANVDKIRYNSDIKGCHDLQDKTTCFTDLGESDTLRGCSIYMVEILAGHVLNSKAGLGNVLQTQCRE